MRLKNQIGEIHVTEPSTDIVPVPADAPAFEHGISAPQEAPVEEKVNA